MRLRLPIYFRTTALARAAWLVAFAVTMLIASRSARAADRASLEEAARSPDAQIAAESLYAVAEIEDADRDYARALADYRASIAKLPSNRYAARAMSRASVLEAHAEGNFVPYAALERVRRDHLLSNNGAALDMLAHDADTFPPGLVRGEARMVCADAFLNRLGRPDDGMQLLRLVMADDESDPLTRRQAAHALVDALVAAGDLDEAKALADANALDSKLAHHVRELVTRRALRRGSIAVLVALGLFASASIAMAARRGTIAAVGRTLRSSAPLALGFAAYVAVAGGALAAVYERGNAAPFLVMGGVLFPLLLVARAWGAAGRATAIARIGRALLAASSVAAAGFLVLEWIDTAYLESFGL